MNGKWRSIAALATVSTGSWLISARLAHDRLLACKAWLDRSAFGSIAEQAAATCVANGKLMFWTAMILALASLATILVALFNLVGLGRLGRS